ncbi:LysR family transcriptional regulator [Pontibaca methylaminivorans]|nr:LysR family transcriptional regulator [Pontibaca methylaminivorans]
MEAFINVVDQGGFTHAARKMGVSKSAVSKHIAALEGRLGTRLLDRTTRRVDLTDIGRAYYERARRALSAADAADSIITALQAPPSGLLRVSAGRDFATHTIAPLLPGFMQAHPGVSFEFLLAEAAAEGCVDGADLALCIGDVPGHGAHARRLGSSRCRLVAAPAYLDRHGPPGRIEDLDHHALLRRQADPPDPWLLVTPAGEVRVQRGTGRLGMDDGRALRDAAIAGLGIAFLPDYICDAALREGRLAEALPGIGGPELGIHALGPPAPLLTPAARAFVDHLAGPLGGNGSEPP